jgi:PleD family two-component response regulator
VESSHIAAKLVKAIREPMQLPGGGEISVTTSIGLACWGGVGEGAEDILDRADRALYRAKAAGRDTFEGLPRYGSKSYISHPHLTPKRSIRLRNKTVCA